MRTLSVLLTLTVGSVLVGFSPAAAMDKPSCQYEYSDADGDGFGWENEATCVVTDETELRPVIVHEETGAEVELVRPYWDANADIANKVIQCESYEYYYPNGYVHEPENHLGYRVFFKYQSVPGQYPEKGWFISQNSLTYEEDSPVSWVEDWSVYDGLLGHSPTPPSLYDHNDGVNFPLEAEYVELVVRPNGSKAIRIWEANRFVFDGSYIGRYHLPFEAGYIECFDTSGADFRPTGSPGVPGKFEPVSINEEYVLTGLKSQSPPIDLRTGEQVQTTTAYWNYHTDIASGDLKGCLSYLYIANPNDDHFLYPDVGPNVYVAQKAKREWTPITFDFYNFLPILEGAVPNTIPYVNDTVSGHNGVDSAIAGTMEISKGAVVGGRIPLFLLSDQVELLDGERVRVWLEDGSEYYECDAFPTASATDGCDYSDADQYDGWGWHPDRKEPCPPLDNGEANDPDPEPDPVTEPDPVVERGAIADATNVSEIVEAADFNNASHSEVLRLYQAIFGRYPDLTGAKYWIGINDSHSVLEIAGFMSASQEWVNNYAGTTDAEFVAKVYANVLGRDYDQDGYEYWLDLVETNQLARHEMVFYVTANTEFTDRYPFTQ